MKFTFLRLLLPLIILFCIDIYSFQAVKTVTQNLSANTRKIIYICFWAISGVVLFMFLAGLFKDFFTWPKAIRVYLTGFLIVIYLTKLIIVIFLFVDDIIRLGKYLWSLIGSPKEPVAPGDAKLTRSLFISQTALIVAAIPFSGLLYGMMVGAFDYKVRRLKISFSNLPKSFDGIKILQVSDIHSGSFVESNHLQKAVDLINNEKADIVFFTGDLVNNRTDEVYPFMEVLAQIKAPMGVYSSLGNHDYGDYSSWNTLEEKHQNLLDLFEVHKKLGWKLLKNENTLISKGGEKIAIAGSENWGGSLRFPKYGNLNMTFASLDNIPFTILMSHDPSHWDAQILDHPHKADLTLAGHTHGFQFGIDTKVVKWSPAQYMYKQWAGLYRKGEQYIYVNRGLGFLGYPGRAGVRPEITVIELKTI
jgi:uncharacterized protein